MPDFQILSLAVAALLGFLICFDAGRRLASRLRQSSGGNEAFSALQGAVFGLLGLLVAFSFAGADARYHEQRSLIVKEANAIGTAYLRLDLLPAEFQRDLRSRMREYTDRRLAFYDSLGNPDLAQRKLASSTDLQREIWARAVAATNAGSSSASTMLVLSSLGDMIDVTTERSAALRFHAAWIIYALLVAVALASCLLAGYAAHSGSLASWLHMGAFAFVLAATLYVIVDLEYPRSGMIRLDEVDQELRSVRQSMGPTALPGK